MVVDLEVALALQLQIEARMLGQAPSACGRGSRCRSATSARPLAVQDRARARSRSRRSAARPLALRGAATLAHGTICAIAKTTMSVPPRSLIARITPAGRRAAPRPSRAKPGIAVQGRHRRLAHARQDRDHRLEAVGRHVDLEHHPLAGIQHRAHQDHEVLDARALLRLRPARADGRRAGSRSASARRRSTQSVRLQRRAGRRVVDDAVGILGREHLGRAVGSHERRLEARAAPARRRVSRSYSVATTNGARRAAPSGNPGRGRDHVRTGSSPVSSSSTSSAAILHHPVGAGEADVARAQMQHLDDVLRLEDLGLEAIQRQGRAIAAPVEGHPDAGVRRAAAARPPPSGPWAGPDGRLGGAGGIGDSQEGLANTGGGTVAVGAPRGRPL